MSTKTEKQVCIYCRADEHVLVHFEGQGEGNTMASEWSPVQWTQTPTFLKKFIEVPPLQSAQQISLNENASLYIHVPVV